MAPAFPEGIRSSNRIPFRNTCHFMALIDIWWGRGKKRTEGWCFFEALRNWYPQLWKELDDVWKSRIGRLYPINHWTSFKWISLRWFDLKTYTRPMLGLLCMLGAAMPRFITPNIFRNSPWLLISSWLTIIKLKKERASNPLSRGANVFQPTPDWLSRYELVGEIKQTDEFETTLCTVTICRTLIIWLCVDLNLVQNLCKTGQDLSESVRTEMNNQISAFLCNRRW